MSAEIEQFTEEFIRLEDLLPTEIIENTELEFQQQFSGFNCLEVKLLNHENYSQDELEQIRETLVEYQQRLLENFKGYDVRIEFPNNEDFTPFDYDNEKVRIEQLKKHELVETSESDDEYDFTEQKDF